MYCRNAVLGTENLGTDCQVVGISGNKVQFIREYGKGKAGVSTFQYRVQAPADPGGRAAG